MSRGGFRGRGRGRAGALDPRIPSFNSREYAEAMRAPNKHGGMLYPPLETKSVAYLPAPSEMEDSILQHSLQLDKILADGLGPMGAPWRLATERKIVGIEIESYSDRFKPPSQIGVTKLDPIALKLDATLFPPALWKEYYEGKEEVKPKTKKRKAPGSDDDVDKEIEEAEKSSESSEDPDFNFDDDDQSDHQDYDHNYFDNGEGDDDSGGEEEDGGIGED